MESLVQKYSFLALVEKCVVGINDGAEKKKLISTLVNQRQNFCLSL